MTRRTSTRHPVLTLYDQVTYVNGLKEHQAVTRYAEEVPAGIGLSGQDTASTDVDRSFFSAILPNKHLEYQVDRQKPHMAGIRSECSGSFFAQCRKSYCWRLDNLLDLRYGLYQLWKSSRIEPTVVLLVIAPRVAPWRRCSGLMSQEPTSGSRTTSSSKVGRQHFVSEMQPVT